MRHDFFLKKWLLFFIGLIAGAMWCEKFYRARLQRRWHDRPECSWNPASLYTPVLSENGGIYSVKALFGTRVYPHQTSNPHYIVSCVQRCSIDSPRNGPLPSDAPPWCQAPFDPEGLLSSLMATVTCLVGLQFGHVIVHCKVRIRIPPPSKPEYVLKMPCMKLSLERVAS
jgi:hypothetical protein